MSDLPWAKWPWQACQAYREPRRAGDRRRRGFFGRCELVKDHYGDHALERGFDVPRWSTDWTEN